MSFYKILSKYYDEVFKLQQATVHFLIEELNEKDRQVQHLLRVCKILEIALNNALGLDYLYTDAY